MPCIRRIALGIVIGILIPVASAAPPQSPEPSAMSLESVVADVVSRNPELRFASDRVQRAASGTLDVQGRLTMRGVTKPLTIRVHPLGSHVVRDEGEFQMFRTEFAVNRYDFGIVGGSVLGPVISRDVSVRIIAAVRASAQR